MDIKNILIKFKGFQVETVLHYYEINNVYNAYLKQGVKGRDAVTWTADDFCTSEATVYRARKAFA